MFDVNFCIGSIYIELEWIREIFSNSHFILVSSFPVYHPWAFFLWYDLFAFLCTANNFATTILVFFFSSCCCFWADCQKLFSNLSPIVLSYYLCSIMNVTRIGVIYRAIKPCPLEINNKSWLKQKHLESSSSTTKNISPLPQSLWSPNL